MIRDMASRTTGPRPYVNGDITLTPPMPAHLTAITARVGSPAESLLASDLGVDGATGGAVMVTAGVAGVDTAATMAEEATDLEGTAVMAEGDIQAALSMATVVTDMPGAGARTAGAATAVGAAMGAETHTTAVAVDSAAEAATVAVVGTVVDTGSPHLNV